MSPKDSVSRNSRRALWRSKCRERLAQHIYEELGLKIHPSHVRLKSNGEDIEYTWKVIDQALLPLFQRHLSKHSIGAYKQLCSEIGKSFHVIKKPGTEQTVENPCHSDLEDIETLPFQCPFDPLESERYQIACQLEEAKRNAGKEYEKRILEEAKVQHLMKRLQEAQNAIQYHQEEIKQWMMLADYYQSSSSRCSNSLQEVITLLHRVHSDVTFVP